MRRTTHDRVRWGLHVPSAPIDAIDATLYRAECVSRLTGNVTIFDVLAPDLDAADVFAGMRLAECYHADAIFFERFVLTAVPHASTDRKFAVLAAESEMERDERARLWHQKREGRC